MTDLVIGVDVSYYEIKWGDPKTGEYWNPDNGTKKVDFVIQRASYGLTKDTGFDFLYENSTKHIPVIGFYHYFSSWYSYKAQMERFLKAIDTKKYDFLAIDYEKYSNNLDARTFAEFCEMVKQLKVITGKKVLSYFNPNVYAETMKPYGADKVINTWDIWLAQYPTMSTWDNYVFPKTFSGAKVLFHQAGGGDVAGTIGIISGFEYGSWRKGIDLNVWGGTKEEMYSFFGVSGDNIPPIEPPIIVPPIEIGKPATVQVSLNIRVSPNGTVIGNVAKGSKITIFEERILSNNTWGRIGTDKWVAILYNGAVYVKYDSTVVKPPVDLAEPSNLYVFSLNSLWPRPDDGPLITPTFNITKTSSTKELILEPNIVNWIKTGLSNTAKAYARIISATYGPSKGFNNNGKLQFNTSIYPGRNVVKVTNLQLGLDGQMWGMLDCINLDNGIPGSDENYIDTPHHVHKVYGSSSKWTAFDLGANAPKVPILQRGSSKFVEMKWLVSVDSFLPKQVITTSSLNIRDNPNGVIIGGYSYGAGATITSVRIATGGIWGKTDKGWIALRNKDVNLTNWSI